MRPEGDVMLMRVRGGSWGLQAKFLRLAYAIKFLDHGRHVFVGLRCVRRTS